MVTFLAQADTHDQKFNTENRLSSLELRGRLWEIHRLAEIVGTIWCGPWAQIPQSLIPGPQNVLLGSKVPEGWGRIPLYRILNLVSVNTEHKSYVLPSVIFFLRGHLSYLLIKWLLTTIKFSIGGSMLNVESLIHLKPNSQQSPIFCSITNKFLHGEQVLT